MASPVSSSPGVQLCSHRAAPKCSTSQRSSSPWMKAGGCLGLSTAWDLAAVDFRLQDGGAGWEREASDSVQKLHSPLRSRVRQFTRFSPGRSSTNTVEWELRGLPLPLWTSVSSSVKQCWPRWFLRVPPV